jgi:hypothetical protein
MIGALLLRGLMAGLIAGLLGFGFAKVVGEPQVNIAIAFEAQADAARGDAPEPVLISRDVQSSWGLLTGVLVYGTALGGLFALVFAASWGRLGSDDAKTFALMIAVTGLFFVSLLPALKYPPNPPSVGQPETIGIRTAYFFLMLAGSLLTAAIAIFVSRRLKGSLGRWYSLLVGAGAVIVIAFVLSHLLPDINEVPHEFPAVVLWRFRIAALGLQVVLWLGIGLIFGELVQRYFASVGQRPSFVPRR